MEKRIRGRMFLVGLISLLISTLMLVYVFQTALDDQVEGDVKQACELIAHGYVSGRGAIGVTVEELPLRARIYFGLPEGAHVREVDPTSDAYAKGLQAGDIITAFEGTPVRGPSTLGTLRDSYASGDTVTVTVFRNGSYFDLDIILMDRVADEG